MALIVHEKAVLGWHLDEGIDIREAMAKDFEITDEDMGTGILLAAVYTYECYEGNAFVLIYKPDTGELLEVDGGHCSCDGLEGQWRPEPTNFAALQMRKFDYCASEQEKDAILELVWEVTSNGLPLGAA